MVQIIPTILTSDLKELKDKLQKLQGLINEIHIDIMDGRFVNNKTIQLKDLIGLKILKDFKIGLHLMVKGPVSLIKLAKKLGAERLIVQVEGLDSQEKFVRRVKAEKMEVGLALDFKTGIDKIDKQVLERLDVVLMMMVKAGWGGQKFIKKRLEEVKKLKSSRQKFKIVVDGGINKENIKGCVSAGADILAIGSVIWESRDVKKKIKELELLANN